MTPASYSFDAISVTIFKYMFQSICDEMGNILQYSAFSPNIKERKDFSCALFRPDGESIAFGTHIPVHLGAMPLSVQAAIRDARLEPGDMILLNDPFRGGTHLPDLTLIAPVFHGGDLVFLVANRAHHSDVGGMRAGSMPLAVEIFQEGLIVPPVKLVRSGQIDRDLLEMILANVRTPGEREGDLRAQMAANHRGCRRMEECIDSYGLQEVTRAAGALMDYTESFFRQMMRELPNGEYRFADVLDDDGCGHRDLKIQVKVTIGDDHLDIDFSGSASQTRGGVNTNRAVTHSAALYVLTAIIGEDIPINSGIMRPVRLVLPPHSIVNAAKPAGLAAGNVETSQRIVDVILGALAQALPGRIPAASQGTMNNVSFGIAGSSYYETIAGGGGASKVASGLDAVHSHMTNSLNTPIEALERDFPVMIQNYRIRNRSGGKGRHRGGNGVVRSYLFQEPGEISILSERRRNRPYGLAGGSAGRRGRNRLKRAGKNRELPSKVNMAVAAGDLLTVETPGGGGYGERKK